VQQHDGEQDSEKRIALEQPLTIAILPANASAIRLGMPLPIPTQLA